MRILYRNLDPSYGNNANYFVDMLGSYCKRFPEDEMTILCPESSTLTELGYLSNCNVETIGKRIPREFYLLGAGDLAMGRLNRKRPFDVYWTNNVGLYLRTKVPTVLSVNNAFQVMPKVDAPHPRSRLRVSLLRALFRRSLRLATAVFVQAPMMKEYTQRIPGCPKRVLLIPKAVDSGQDGSGPELAARIAERLEGAGSAAKLLYVATGNPHKNHKVLAAMMEEFRQKGSPVRLVVTLNGEQWRELAGAGADSLVASGHVILLGWVHRDELKALYEACDLCVMPSLLESLSSAHLEAMHWKRPQVAADLPYAHSLCGDAALYANPNEPSAWRRQVERLLADAQLQQALMKKGTQRDAIFPGNWTEMAERIREALVAIVADPSR
jgi:glycosyltransferase involved in cell wall biosynthesis